MKTHADDQLIAEGFVEARRAEASRDEIEAVMSRLAASPRRESRLGNPALGSWLVVTLGVFVLCGGLLAVPSVRAAIGDAGSEFGGFFGLGSDSEPGRPLTDEELKSDSLPPWLTHGDVSGQRVIATEGDHGLYMRQSSAGYIDFSLDNSLSFGDTPDGWSRQLADKTLLVLAPLKDGSKVALFGLSAGDVDSVSVTYQDGDRVVAKSSSGGFIAQVDPTRNPASIEALDSDGKQLDSEDLGYITWESLAK